MKHIHTEGPGSILQSRFARGVVPLVAALLACALAAPSARATTLVYEGFSSSDYAAGQSINGIKSGKKSVGLDTVNGWNSGTGVFLAQSSGLSLPSAWTRSGSTVYGTEDLSAALYNTTSTSATRDNRAQQRKLTCTWPTSGSIYFRFLMQVPKAALSTSYLGNGNYWVAGLGTEAIEKPTTGDQCNIANGIYMGVRNRNGTLEVAAYVKNPADGATFTKPLFTIDTSETLRCACIAKIDIGEDGNDTLSFYAAPTNTLTTDFAWTFTTNGIALVSGSAKPSYLQMLGHYKVNSQYITFDEFLVTTDEDEAYAHASRLVPALGTVAMSRTGAAVYSLSATEDANAADIAWIANNGSTATTNGWKSVDGGATASWTISNLSADKTYKISILATNESGTAEATAGTLYTGMLMLDASSATDAYEYGSVTGGVTVARASADPFPLTVNYTISGSAGTEGTTWAAPVAVTIPANETSAVLPVVPLMDGDVTSDVTITVALASGNYELPASNAATLTLVNLAAPAGKKTWVATANGNASDGANWSPSGAPTATDEILFDGNFSNANCTWDVATHPRVASFTQTADYNGAVVFDIAYPTDTSTPSGDGAFEVTGSAELLGGKWTQVACGGYSDTKRLAIKIGGDLTIAAGASIDVTLKGSKGGHARAGCYGGDNGEFGKVYGDPKYPFWCGSGNGADNSLAGGAVWLEVAGDVTLNGDIISNGTSGSSGGSVYLKAASLLGSGHIYANGNGWSSKGSGGRIAVELTNSPLPATLTVPGNFQAYGSYGGSVGPAPGTIVIKEPGQANGDLYVSNGGGNFARWNPPRFGASVNELTTIPANAVWTFDHVYIGGYGTLCVGEGATLNLPNGFVSLGDGGMSGVRRMSSLMLLGGTLNVPAVDGVHTFGNGAFFYPATHYAFAAGGVVVKSGASIGASYLKSARDEHVCDFAVTGDLTVEAGGYVDVSLGGFGGQNENYTYTQAGCHGGQSAEKSGNQAYGSVFAPSLGGGTNGGNQDAPQIGAASLKVSVSGTLTVNGTVTASASENPKFGTASGNAGGSIDITAATLAGTGIIAADGSEGFKADDNLRYNLGRGTSRGGGGRIAIRLTDGDFSSFDVTKITATGWYSNHNVAGDFDKTPLASSAGTVYLQPSGVGEKCGTVYIRNTGTVESSNWTHSLTWLPAGTRGDAVSDFRYADLVLDGAAWVALSASFRAKSVALASNCAIDLNGETLVVERATLGGVKLSPGTYAAGDAAVADYLVDTAEGAGGSLVVSGGGLSIVVR